MEAEASGALERARSGDNEAFRLLVQQHGRGIFRLAYRMTGNEEDAEDVVQETFLKAYRQIDRYEARCSFSTWLYRIASNCSLDLIRKRKLREHKRRACSGSGPGCPRLHSGGNSGARSGAVQQPDFRRRQRGVRRTEHTRANGVCAAAL